jgi:hypothetical protein
MELQLHMLPVLPFPHEWIFSHLICCLVAACWDCPWRMQACPCSWPCGRIEWISSMPVRLQPIEKTDVPTVAVINAVGLGGTC